VNFKSDEQDSEESQTQPTHNESNSSSSSEPSLTENATKRVSGTEADGRAKSLLDLLDKLSVLFKDYDDLVV
jgi:hypothetical protein